MPTQSPIFLICIIFLVLSNSGFTSFIFVWGCNAASHSILPFPSETASGLALALQHYNLLALRYNRVAWKSEKGRAIHSFFIIQLPKKHQMKLASRYGRTKGRAFSKNCFINPFFPIYGWGKLGQFKKQRDQVMQNIIYQMLLNTKIPVVIPSVTEHWKLMGHHGGVTMSHILGLWYQTLWEIGYWNWYS